MGGAFAPHPGSEPFVEPEIVPPSHGHEVAEPLVRGLVRDHLINALLGGCGRFLRVEQKGRLEVSNATPIFHRAAKTTGDRDLIEFGQGILDAKIIVIVLQNLGGALERVSAPFGFSLRGNHPNLCSRHLRLNRIQFAGNENVQVTRHRRRRLKTHFLAGTTLVLGLDWHV